MKTGEMMLKIHSSKKKKKLY